MLTNEKEDVYSPSPVAKLALRSFYHIAFNVFELEIVKRESLRKSMKGTKRKRGQCR